MLEFATWFAIILVISLRSIAVYSHHFIQDHALLSKREQLISWFRFYKPGFSRALGTVAFFLAAVAFMGGSIPWTLGNLVFGIAAFINFQDYQDKRFIQGSKQILSSKFGSRLFFVLIPMGLFLYLFSGNAISTDSWSGFSGIAFSYVGAYLLALVFLSMKLGLWGTMSHEAWPYLLGVLVWDLLLLMGAILDGNLPFIFLESYAVLLDGFTLFIIKLVPSKTIVNLA